MIENETTALPTSVSFEKSGVLFLCWNSVASVYKAAETRSAVLLGTADPGRAMFANGGPMLELLTMLSAMLDRSGTRGFSGSTITVCT